MIFQNGEDTGLFIPAISEITELGIKHRDKYYSCPTAIRQQWFKSLSSNRTSTIFVDPLCDEYLLISLENGCLEVAQQIQNDEGSSSRGINEYYEMINNIKRQIKECKRKT